MYTDRRSNVYWKVSSKLPQYRLDENSRLLQVEWPYLFHRCLAAQKNKRNWDSNIYRNGPCGNLLFIIRWTWPLPQGDTVFWLVDMCAHTKCWCAWLKTQRIGTVRCLSTRMRRRDANVSMWGRKEWHHLPEAHKRTASPMLMPFVFERRTDLNVDVFRHYSDVSCSALSALYILVLLWIHR